MFTIAFCECFCLLFVTVEEPQYFIFHKHVSLLENSISLIFLVCLTHEVGSSANGNWQRGKLTKWELTKWEVDQMVIDDVGIDKMKIDNHRQATIYQKCDWLLPVQQH